MNKKLLPIIFLFYFTAIQSQSKDYDLFMESHIVSEKDSNSLKLLFENFNFFKNNEYFNKIVEGYTFLGTWLRPSLIYQPSTNVAIQGGFHYLKYSGRDEIFVQPYFRFHYKVLPDLHFVMGNLYGSVNHQLIEPIYGFERFMENNNENGVQFISTHKRFNGDVWLNWEKFIFRDDPFKEEFSSGLRTKTLLTNTDNPLKITLPLEYLFAHKGGQVDLDSVTPLFTRMNIAGGIALEYDINRSFVKTIGFNAYGLYYKDNTHSVHTIRFVEGNGVYANAFLKASFINITMGYWNGYRFFNPRGDMMFSGISFIPTSSITQEKRELLLSKVFIHKKVQENITVAAAFESFYDTNKKQYDFYYAMYAMCNLDFLLHVFK